AQIVRRHHEEQVLEVATGRAEVDADEELAYQELKDAFLSGLNDLPDKTREIFWLSRMDQLSVREISGMLNIPERTITYHIARALDVLKIHLRDFFILLFFAIFR